MEKENWDRKLNDTYANDDGEDNATAHSGCEGCSIRIPDADDAQVGLEVYRQHIAATTCRMELMSGGSKRLPCNVKSDEMGNWIWICEGLGHRVPDRRVTDCCRR